MVSFGVPSCRLFAHADRKDYVLMTIGLAGALFNGVAFPLFTIVFGQLINSIGTGTTDLQGSLRTLVLYFTGLACISLVASYVQVACFMASACRQANRIRLRFLHSALHQASSLTSQTGREAALLHRNAFHVQDVSFYDVDTNSGALLQGVTQDIQLIQIALSDKLALFLQNFTTFIVGLIVAFVGAWDLTLVGLSLIPVMGVIGFLMVCELQGFECLGRLRARSRSAMPSCSSRGMPLAHWITPAPRRP